MRVAIAHDWLNQLGGAEDVLAQMVSLFPGAPIHTSIYWRDAMPAAYRDWDVRVSFMDRLPFVHRRHQAYLPLYPWAFERFSLRTYDVVVSNKSGFCHGVRAGSALHVCYCLTPTRYVWGFDDYAAQEGLGPAARVALRPLLAALKRWDRAAADRVTEFVAISTEVQRRIRRFYGRESAVIYPPVDTRRFNTTEPQGATYLSLGRLIAYKRVDFAVQALTRLNRPLKVGGDGRDRPRLERLAGSSIQFLGRVPDQDVARLVADCRAFIFPGLEDFGIAPVQAMAAGRPVIAYAGGGALDTIIDGVTGVLFKEPTVDSLADAVERFERMTFDAEVIRRHAEQFDVTVFRRRMVEFIERKI